MYQQQPGIPMQQMPPQPYQDPYAQPMQGQPMMMPGQPMMAPVQQPMAVQPQAIAWMPMPETFSGCPPGLEYLSQLDQLLVKQEVEILEMLTNIETENKYNVQNALGQHMYRAEEKSDCCARQFCGPNRTFDIHVRDNAGTEVIHVSRPMPICALHEMTVTSPITGELLGKVKQNCTFLPSFNVEDAYGHTVLEIRGPLCTISFCGNVDFELVMGGQVVGKISKEWSGLLKEAFTDADNFGVTFPVTLDVKTKATLLGAIFLIDFMFFEKKSGD